jgi:hypothetical protein
MFQANPITVDSDEIVKRAQRRKAGFSWLSRIPFIGMALVGMGLILGLKWQGVSQYYVTSIAVACLVVYWVFVSALPKFRIREDQLGDNCYYLGFLYTLTSLAYALWIFATEPNDHPQILEIVGNFGLALATTIAGILLRVTINQQRRDVVENEQEARRLLTEAVTNMRIQLNDATITMEAFQRDTRQAIKDALERQVETANEALAQSVAKVGEASTGVIERIDKAFEEFSSNSQTLNEISAGTVKAVRQLVTRIEKIEAPADLLTSRLEPALKAAVSAAEVLRDRVQADEAALAAASERSAKIEAAFEQAGWAFQGVVTILKNAAEESKQASAAIGGMAADLSKMASSTAQTIERQLDLNKTLGTGLEGAVGVLRAHNDAMAKEVARARTMAAETGEALGTMADAITRKISQMRSVSVELEREAALGGGN